ncbi:MAG: response regulator [Terracidiphilus sp.]|jgi:CheY-like chemotaxis protein
MQKFGSNQGLPRVLLVDDDMVSREVMATVLTMSGYTIQTAVGGQAALEMLASGGFAPEVILLDAQMPGLSGVRLIEQIHARSRAAVYTMSGSTPSSEIVNACDGFLLKPFSPEALTRLLEEHAEESPTSAATAPKSDEPVINPETLAQLREIMPEAAVRQIYAAIVSDLLKRLIAIEAAMAKGDAAEIRRIGHAIKGGCSMAGALQAAHLGARLEDGVLEAKGNQLDNSSPVLRDLRDAAANLKRMLEAEFPASGLAV